ncbi:protein TIFY 6b [Canna indica]|uniref:Protein TIFY n=1 Tax=Canna indica TaxID=4628 RepID=A0AAQ3KKT2_9LILI|nr:protein TIFY 6b [Canna indica]
MERDFLGMSGGGKEDAKRSCHDAGLAVQWPLTNKTSSMQQFMSYKVAQEERTTKFGFDQLPSSTFSPVKVVDAFEINHSNSPALSQKKSFSLHDYQSQGTTTFTLSPHQMSENRAFPVVSHHSIPIATNSPFFKFHSTQSAPSVTMTTLNQQPFGGVALNSHVINTNVGAPSSRSMLHSGPATAQLTIFYAGAVHVYDDVTFDKAQAIMLLASKGSNGIINATRSEAPSSVTTPDPAKISVSDGLSTKQVLNPTPIRVASPCSGFSNQIAVAKSKSCLRTKIETNGAKFGGPVAVSVKQEPSTTLPSALGTTSTEVVASRAVPQARKASLARFLEKRKERVNDAMPYPSIKRNPETGSVLESSNASSISSSADVNLSSNRSDSWCLGRPRNSIDSVESLSTKLEM